jgi:Ti-type conjugative transfer relaxase TraA
MDAIDGRGGLGRLAGGRAGAMLNVAKLAPGGEGYYLDTVASGVEDYYTGSGEAAGYWLGAATPILGLAGPVDAEALRAVLGAVDPGSGESLTGRMSRRTVPGFDCTFRAPKSVSVLYGLGDLDTSATVRDAHDTAVAAAVGYLETHAGFSRRGHGGAERVAVRGFVAAAFRHRTSRAGDPLLHTHVLVANVGRAVDDGAWRTLDGRSLYLHAKTAGYLYQAQLRAELTRRLGVEWGEVRNGCADVAGVTDEVIRAFSRRRAEITARMEQRGETSAKAAQVATLATRRAKDRQVEPAVLGAEWLTRAAALGFGPEQVAAVTGKDVDLAVDPAVLTVVAEELAGPQGLTERASTFTRRDAVRAWCDRLPAGADTDQVLTLADALLAGDAGTVVRLDHAQAVTRGLSGDQVIRRGDGRIVRADPEELRYSTPELLALEQRVITGATTRQHAGVAIADPAALDAALQRRPTIVGEQAAMVRWLATSGAGVEVVVGRAGAGKTFGLDAAREAWQASGVRVIGCALAARAAEELNAGAGIDSYTIDALLADLDRPGPGGGLAPGGVLVVDEAGMVGTRKLARLFDHADRADAKVVLVGDHHQLPEIDAGGVFRGLVNRLPAIELCDNRRQREAWERDALDELRSGDPGAALAAYTAAGRVVIGDTAEAVREQLVSDWWAARTDYEGPGEAGVMIAARVSDVDDLNDRARTRLAAAGELTGPVLRTAAGRDFRVGDRVLCLRNDRRLGVVNGTRAHVVAVAPDAGTLTARVDRSGDTVTLARDYLDAGHVTHAYAITGHKAQGLTTDQAWVLGSDAIYREWGYVALSRGRDSNRLYIVGADDPVGEEPHAHGPDPAGDPAAELVRALGRSRAQHLALDQTQVADLLAGRDPNEPAADRDRLAARIHAAVPPAASRTADRLEHQRGIAVEQAQVARQRLDDAQARLTEMGGLRRLLHADAARSTRADVARLAGDLRGWEERIITLDAEFAGLDGGDQRHQATGRDDEAVRGFTAVTAALDVRLRHTIEAAEFNPPDYLLTTVGPRPDTPDDRRAWRSAVRAVESYRAAWSVTDPVHPLGQRPTDAAQARAHDEVAGVIGAVQRRLVVDNSEEVMRTVTAATQDLGVGIG